MLTPEQIDIDKLADVVVKIAKHLEEKCSLTAPLTVNFKDASGTDQALKVTGTSGGGLAGRRCT
jgi:hypothetical protein